MSQTTLAIPKQQNSFKQVEPKTIVGKGENHYVQQEQQQAQQGARLRRAGAVLLQAAVRVHHSGGLPGVPEPPGILRGGYELDMVREEVPRLRLTVFAGDLVCCFGEMHKKTWHFFKKVCNLFSSNILIKLQIFSIINM